MESEKVVWEIAMRELMEIYGLIHSAPRSQAKLGNYIRKAINGKHSLHSHWANSIDRSFFLCSYKKACIAH